MTPNGLFRPTTYVGARTEPPVLERAAPSGGAGYRAPRHHVRYRFTREILEIDNTPYNRRLVADGSLLAADAETAKRCGLQAFTDPDARLAELGEGCAVEPLWSDPEPEKRGRKSKSAAAAGVNEADQATTNEE